MCIHIQVLNIQFWNSFHSLATISRSLDPGSARRVSTFHRRGRVFVDNVGFLYGPPRCSHIWKLLIVALVSGMMCRKTEMENRRIGGSQFTESEIQQFDSACLNIFLYICIVVICIFFLDGKLNMLKFTSSCRCLWGSYSTPCWFWQMIAFSCGIGRRLASLSSKMHDMSCVPIAKAIG